MTAALESRRTTDPVEGWQWGRVRRPGRSLLLLSVALAAMVSAAVPSEASSSAPKVGIVNFGYDDVAGAWRVEKHPRLLSDVNLDGKADIVGFGGNGTYVALGRADGTFSAAKLGIANFGYNTVAGGWRVERHPRLLGDVNGDKKPDIVGFAENGTKVSLGKGDGTFALPTPALNAFGYNDNVGAWRVEKHPRLLSDVNLDGKADIVGFAENGAKVSLGRGDGTFTPAALAVNAFGYNDNVGAWRVEKTPRLLGDVNGDGKADIVGFGYKATYVSVSS